MPVHEKGKIIGLKHFLIGYIFLIVAANSSAQEFKTNARLIISQNSDWLFAKDSAKNMDLAGPGISWLPVSLPHTWNVADVMDDQPGYYRGVGWYRKTLTVERSWKGRQLFLYFEGANQETVVFINGKKAGSHTGGYTAFCVPISPFLKPGGQPNEVMVKVDNSLNVNVPPISADFTFYGGLYRSVSLIAVNEIHFSQPANAAKAVFISTPKVSEKTADVNIGGSFVNSSGTKVKIKISSSVYDRQHKLVKLIHTLVDVDPGKEKKFTQLVEAIGHPRLWSPGDPYLYTVTTTLTDAVSAKILDEVSNPLGFRWFNFDADKGFFLNGKSYKLIGTSRHQDYKGLGNAVDKKLTLKDVAFIKNMGANFLRIAHYPQDQAVLQACDELGLLTSVEIPVVNEITESASFYNNCINMQVEMIRQNYNHPSVIIWCYMNEIFLRPHFNGEKERQKKYFTAIASLAKTLDSVTRKEDSSRYTMIANHADFARYDEYGLTTLSMLTGWNLYSGWYGGKLEDFSVFLDKHHQKLPKQPFIVAEYGADADNRIRSMEPVRFDKSVEYTTRFHQYYIGEIMKRPFVAGAVIWNLADFNSETRSETMPHINNKGLLTWDRIPKDPYYLYQSLLLQQPFIKIASANWKTRGGVADSLGNYCSQPLQVASNLNELELTINGQSIGKAIVQNGLAEWVVPFKNGINRVEATGYRNGQPFKDSLEINFLLQPYLLAGNKTPFKQLNILLGARRYFIDDLKQQVWLPDQAYRPGSWGYIGGKPFKIDGGTRLPFGTDKAIAGTEDDPVYQTQQTGIEKYCLDVPAGRYELRLYFAELQGGLVKNPPYNLADSLRDEAHIRRSFDVDVNEVSFLQHFNMQQQYGSAKAIEKITTVTVNNNSGITIRFKPIEGEPVLNALQLKKLD